MHGGQAPDASNPRERGTVYLDYVESLIYDDFSYPGTSLFALRALATDKLSGGMPTLSFIATRSTVPVWNGSAYVNKPANNPAWASYDVLHNAVYGGGVAASKMRYSDFLAWANNCDLHYTSPGVPSAVQFKCNYYIDTSETLRSVLNSIGQLGRGNTVQIGSEFSCFIDKLETVPAQSFIFNMANIVEKSFSLEYMETANRANAVDVTFWDASNNYKQRTIELLADDFDTVTTEIKKTQLTLKGCTSLAEALAHGYFALNNNRYLTCTASFVADIDAIGCMPWDVIEVQHDVTLWGEGGYVSSASSPRTVVIDKDVTLQGTVNYVLRIQHKDTDVIKQYAVEEYLIDVTTRSIIVTEDLSPVPQAYDKWVLTATGAQTKLFRMLRTSRASDLKRTLTCLEYNPAIYDDTKALTPDSGLVSPEYESHLKAVEMQLWNGSPETAVHLSWTGFAAKWYVFFRRPGEVAYTYVGETAIPYYRLTGLEALPTAYTFCVSHTRSPMEGITTTLIITGKGTAPETPLNFTASLVGRTIELNWTTPTDIRVRGYSIYLNGSLVSTLVSGNKYVYNGNLNYGDYNFTLTALTYGGESAPTDQATVTVEKPDTPNVDGTTDGSTAVITWSDCKTSLDIEYYTVEGVKVGNTLRYTCPITWNGNKTFHVIAVDVAANLSEEGEFTLVIGTCTVPTSITTTGQVFSINIGVTYPAFAGFQCVEIWGSKTVNDRTQAVKIGETTGNELIHTGLGLVEKWYYWARTKDIYGNYGDWYPTEWDEGVEGQTSTDPTDYLTLLNGAITEDQLVMELASAIQAGEVAQSLIGPMYDNETTYDEGDIVIEWSTDHWAIFSCKADGTVGHDPPDPVYWTEMTSTLADRVATAEVDIDQANADILLRATVSQVTGTVAVIWNASDAYSVNSTVMYEITPGVWRLYYCTVANTGHPPSDAAYWTQAYSVGNRLRTAEIDIDANQAAILLRATQTEINGTVAPLWSATATYAIGNVVRYNYSGTNWRLYRCKAVPPVGTVPTNTTYWEINNPLAVRMNTAEVDINAAEADILLRATKTELDGTIAPIWSASTSYAVGAEVRYNYSGTAWRIYRCIVASPAGTLPTNTSYWTYMSPVAARLYTAEVDINAAEAAILLRASKTELDAAVAATWSATTAYVVGREVRYNYSGTSWRTYRCILAPPVGTVPTNTTYWEIKGSLATRMTTAEMDINAAELAITQRLAISTYDADQKVGGVLRIATAESSLSLHGTDLTNIKAQYTIKLGVGSKVAGFGLMLSSSVSKFEILCDQFKVCMPDASGIPVQVFTVGTVDGAPMVGISGNAVLDGSLLARNVGANEIIANTANIKDAIITTAKIKDLQVTTLKIGNNAVTVPVFAKQAAASIDLYSYWTDVCSATITASGGKISLIFSAEFQGVGPPTAKIRMTRNGTVIYPDLISVWPESSYLVYGSTQMRGQAFVGYDQPTAGTYTYTVQLIVVSGTAFGHLGKIIVLECKK